MGKKQKPKASTERIVEIAPLPPAAPNPRDVFALALAGAQGAMAELAYWQGIGRRLQTYRRLHPERYAHVVAFVEKLEDEPTPETIASVLEAAKPKE